jgi:hypothetical protein
MYNNYKLGNELGWEFYQIGFVKEPPPYLPKLGEKLFESSL